VLPGQLYANRHSFNVEFEKQERILSSLAASKTTAGRYYRPELDVVRFLAFTFVFLGHTLPTDPDSRIANVLGRAAPILYVSARACKFGLSLFFALSAFLICELLIRERETVGTVGVVQFYIRRILRIWPLYYLGVALGTMFAFLPDGHPSDLVRMGWLAIFMGSWMAAIHGPISNPAGPLWSISVEEQFYLFAPWIVKYFNRKSLYGFGCLLFLVSNAQLYYLGRLSATDSRIWADAFVQFQCFAAGILLCLILRGRLPRIAVWKRLSLLAGTWLCWFCSCFGLHSSFNRNNNPGGWSLIGGYALGSLGSVLLLVAFLGVNPKLLPGWAIYLGRISFGLYVYHEFAMYLTNHVLFGHLATIASPILFLKAGSEFGLTVLMATLSYRYYEKPFLKLKKRHTVVESEPIGALAHRSH
jgi:peptidoglycan/LPS O-acetylase OafA/YrhL